jgi:GTP-binding protein
VEKRANGLHIKEAEFMFGAPSAEGIPKQKLSEVAVVGRSNVGKSTFLNRLTGRKIARVSGNPGSTRELNFFNVRGALAEREFTLALVDMPGFGYAKLPKSEREAIARSAVSYLRTREQLQAVILLNDCRRLPEEDELAVQRICGESGIHCLIVVTKMDALTKNERVRSLAGIARAYRLESQDLLFTGEGISCETVWERLLAVV